MAKKMKKKSSREAIKVIGEIQKTRKGFGFIQMEDGDDVYVSRRNMMGAMNGDTVEAVLLPSYMTTKSREGEIKKIIQRKYTEIVGTFERHKFIGYVVPEDKKLQEDVSVRPEFFRGAREGDKVVVKITKYPDKNNGAEGKISEIVARCGQVGSDILAMIRSYGLHETFPGRVNTEAKARAGEAIGPEELAKRSDFRQMNTFTIDGPDAKDLDDAVSVERLEGGGYRLGVHIADVSHYVTEDGYLDREALKRGTSVYLINRVVPMLPKALSNGICSLNEGVDRLTLSCIMDIDGAGKVFSHRIERSVINSKARLIYDDVSDILEGKDEEGRLAAKYGEILEDILVMGELAQILRRKREEMGSLDFNIDEAEIKVDEQERPISIKLADRRSANRMIEEFMLAANETVAEHFFWLEAPFVYRVHERPDGEKLMELRDYLMNFKIRLKGTPENILPKTLADIIEEIKGRPYEGMVSRVMLKTMKKAFYSPQCEGHFGLALKYYCHFTSPIRRYPDLIIHRIIKTYLDGEVSEARRSRYAAQTEVAADLSSKTERQAMELEREVEKFKKAQYMKEHIGEEFDGVVSGVTEFGVYVELENTIEGMAFARTLRRTYQLGEKVRIRVLDAKPAEREIDFLILEEDGDAEEPELFLVD